MSCDYELMTLLLPEEEYPMEPFLWYLPAVQIWCSFLLLDWRYRDFKLVILLTLSSSKLIFILLILGKSKLSLFALFYYCGQAIVTLLSLGKTCHEKQSKPSLFDKNSRTTHRIWHKSFSVIQSAKIRNWFPLPMNRL